MNPYPFSFNQSALFKKGYYGKQAKNIRWKVYGKQRLMSMSAGDIAVHLNVDTSEGQFFFQRKHVLRDGLPLLNDAWKDAKLPDTFSSLCFQLSLNMRNALYSESVHSEKRKLRNHSIYAFQTSVPYVQTSAMNKAKALFLDLIRKKLDTEYAGLKIECDLFPHMSHFQSKSEFLLHIESPELQDERFESELRLDLLNMSFELDKLVGTEVIAELKKKNDSKLHVFIHEELFPTDYIYEHHFAPGESVLEITQYGLTIGVECSHSIPGYECQYFRAYSLLNGKNKKYLVDDYIPFGRYSQFDLENTLLYLKADYEACFNGKWEGLITHRFEREDRLKLNEEKFHEKFYHEFLDTFDVTLFSKSSEKSGTKNGSALLVVNDPELLNNDVLYEEATKLLKNTLEESFL